MSDSLIERISRTSAAAARAAREPGCTGEGSQCQNEVVYRLRIPSWAMNSGNSGERISYTCEGHLPDYFDGSPETRNYWNEHMSRLKDKTLRDAEKADPKIEE
jgi:hypothetical protein